MLAAQVADDREGGCPVGDFGGPARGEHRFERGDRAALLIERGRILTDETRGPARRDRGGPRALRRELRITGALLKQPGRAVGLLTKACKF